MGKTIVASRMKERREQLGLTLDDIASEIGVAKSTIQRYEKGTIERLKLPVIEAIAGVLNVNPSWLVGKSDVPDADTLRGTEAIPSPAPLALAPDEQTLITDYRDASDEIREEAGAMLHRSAERNRKERVKNSSNAG